MGQPILKEGATALWLEVSEFGEIKEGNPGKDFQQGKPPNPWLNPELHMCQGDTSAPRRNGLDERLKGLSRF